MAMMQHYEEYENSIQQIWTDDVPRLKAKYEQYGYPFMYIDLNQIEGKLDLNKGVTGDKIARD